MILCAQAFHWFDPRAALAQFGRVLAPGGAVALFWKDELRSDPFTKAADDLEKEWSGHPPIDMATGLLEGVTPFWRASRFGEPQRRVFDVRLPFTVAGGSDTFEIAAKEYLYLARRNRGA